MKVVRSGASAKLLLLLVSSLTVMAGAIVAPSLPGVRHAFESAPGIELLSRLVLTTPALAVVFSAAPLGFVSDRWGRKPVLIGGLFAYAIGGSSGLYVDGIPLLLIGRVILGVGVGATLTCVTALIADYFADEARRRLLGLQASFMGFGGMVFLMAGGVLADVSWRAPFATYLAALLLVPACALALDEPPRAASLPAGAMPPTPSNRPLLAGLYAAAAMGFVLFYLIPVQIPFSLTQLGASGARVGLALGLMTLVSSLSSLWYARLAARLRPPQILAGTFICMVPGFALLALADTYWTVLLALLAVAPPLGQLMPNLSNWLASSSPPNARGRLLGGLTMAVFTGQFLSPIAAAPIVARGGLHGTSGAFAASALAAGIVGTLVAVLAINSR